jgi:hypothetical protein
VRDQALQHELEVLREHRDRHVVAQRADARLPLQPLARGPRERRGVRPEPLPERRVGAQAARHLQPGAEPAVLPLGVGQQLAHHLHEALLGDDVGHAPGVLLGEGEEERFLVAEVVEDRAPGQADDLLEPTHGGTLVAVRREAGARAVEDLLPSRREPVRADAGHGRDLTRDHALDERRPNARANPAARG